MNLPSPKNLLRYRLKEQFSEKGKNLYNLLHTRTEVEIVEAEGRSWLKIKFLTIQ